MTRAGTIIVGLVAIGVLIVGAVWAVWALFTKLPAAVAAPTVTVAVTALVSVWSVLIATRQSRISEIEKDHRNQKIPVYTDFLQVIFRMFMASKTGQKPLTEEQMIKGFADFTRQVMLWGGPELLQAWNEFRGMSLHTTEPRASVEMVWALERLLLALRRDVGQSNKNLAQGDLLRTFINDLDEYLPAKS